MSAFPVFPQRIAHRFGGVITAVHRVGHRTEKPRDGRSRDDWFFIADVAWDDGTKSASTEVHPGALCADSDNKDLASLLEAMNGYLAANGTWSTKGEHSGWYATERGSSK